MKFPKVWLPVSGQSLGGAVGAATSRALAQGGAPVTSTVSAESDAQHTRHGIDEVQLLGGEGGFYSMGNLDVPAANTITVVSSSGARGKFARKGSYTVRTSEGYGQFAGASSALQYIGRGDMLSFVTMTPLSAATYDISITRDGRTRKLFVELTNETPSGAAFIPVDAALGANAFRTVGWGLVHPNLTPFYLRTDDGAATLVSSGIPYFAGRAHTIPNICRIGSTTLLGLVGVRAIGYAPYFILSTDNGSTWASLSAPSVWAAYNFTGALFFVQPRILSTAVDASIIPLRGGKALIIMPYYTAGASFHSVVLYDPQAASILSTIATIAVDPTVYVMVSTPTAQIDGHPMVQFTRQLSTVGPGTVADDTAAFMLTSADNGLTWLQHPLPGVFSHVGLISVVDRKTWVLPVYDGDYALYQTVDFGATWTKRGTLYSDPAAPAPDPIYYALLPRFSVVVQTRTNDSPAPIFPGMPWVGDSRLSTPA